MASFKSIQRNKQRRRNRCKKTSRFHANRLRLVVHRSLRHFEAQIIDDSKGLTIVSSSSRDKDFKKAKAEMLDSRWAVQVKSRALILSDMIGKL